MLSPTADVKRIELEGVAPEDLAAGALLDDRFVGVDLTEYEGGEDGRTARRILLTQVKYSPLHPQRPWTLSRLTASAATPGNSVLRKLARAFSALRHELRAARSHGEPPLLVVELHTNQPLDRSVAEPLRRAQETLRGDPTPSRATFSRLAAADLRTIKALRDATEVGDEDFAEFVSAWDTASFGRPMLAEAEAALWTALHTFTSDVTLGSLLSFVQERAMPMRARSVRRHDVLGLLRILEQDFWPAPPLFEARADLINTDDLRKILEHLSAATSVEAAAEPARPIRTFDTRDSVRSTGVSAEVLVVHGRSGTGKTSTLRLLARTPGLATVTYDCFADAKGLEPTSARYPVQRCLTQIVNELDELLGTALFASARLDIHHVLVRFERAVRSAATAAAKRGMRLVLAFDAVDNAQQAAERAPVQLGESFVPLLWTIAWPKNCTVIVS
ncbi:MAG: AAA family ATPase, partial [Candidatus Rokuibacteriota bacterium]